MHQFKDLGIETESQSFTGNKMPLDQILNSEIKVINYEIRDSKFDKGSGKCLFLQIELTNVKYVVFTGSVNLMRTIEKVKEDQFPFTTIIIKQNRRFEFS